MGLINPGGTMRTRSTTARIGLAVLAAVPFAGVGATVTARAAGAAGVPGVPRTVSAVQAGEGAARVMWKAPASNGGAAITGYTVTPYKAGVAQTTVTFKSAKTNEVVTGLQNGTPYRFSVVARNAVGKGASSAASGAIIVGAPGRPVIFIVTLMAPGQLRVTMRTAAYRGPARVTRFDVSCTSSNGGVPGSGFRQPVTAPTVFVNGLTHGKTYKCTATATNARGVGLHSLPSAPTVV